MNEAGRFIAGDPPLDKAKLEQAAILVLPRHTYAFPPLATGAPLELGPFAIRSDHLVMLCSALGLAAAVQLVLYRTRFGLALRVIIGNPVAATGPS